MYSFYIKFSTYAKTEIADKISKNGSQKNSYPHIVDKVVNKYSMTQDIVNK